MIVDLITGIFKSNKKKQISCSNIQDYIAVTCTKYTRFGKILSNYNQKYRNTYITGTKPDRNDKQLPIQTFDQAAVIGTVCGRHGKMVHHPLLTILTQDFWRKSFPEMV